MGSTADIAGGPSLRAGGAESSGRAPIRAGIFSGPRSSAGGDVEDVARGVAYMASLSLEANVQFMTVMATKMPYIGRG